MTLTYLLQFVPRQRAARTSTTTYTMLGPIAAFALLISTLVLPGSLAAQQTDNAGNTVTSVAASPTTADVLPDQALGANDLLQIMVPYCPELSRSFRIGSDGTLTLPLIKQPIEAAGLEPAQVEKKIAAALVAEQVLIDPIVNVSVLEYRSKPVNVVGAVNHPITFEAAADTTLIDAITKAGGLTATVGPTITVTRHEQSADGSMHVTVQSIPVRGLMDQADPKLNVKLVGGEEVRIPEAGHIFVAGNVKKPGSYPMQDNSDTTVVKALALSEGLEAYSAKEAFIYREEGAGQPRQQITVQLSEILKRKSPDVVLQPDDILYVPENNNQKMTAKVLTQLAGFGAATATGMLIYR
jgi:polysaccharide export outer membrane protein